MTYRRTVARRILLAIAVASAAATVIAACSSSGGSGAGSELDAGSGSGSSSGASGGSSGGSSGSGSSSGSSGSNGSSSGSLSDDGGAADAACPLPALHPATAGDILCESGDGGGPPLECLSTSSTPQCCVGGLTGTSTFAPETCVAFGGGCNAGGVSGFPIECEQTADCAANGVTGAACCLYGSFVGPEAVPGCPASDLKISNGTGVTCETADGGAFASGGVVNCAPGQLQVCEQDSDCPAGATCTPVHWKVDVFGVCLPPVPPPDAGPQVLLTILNFDDWCSEIVNGGGSIVGTSHTVQVPASSTVTVTATATAGFQFGPEPWFLPDGGQVNGVIAGDGGSGSTSTVTFPIGTAEACIAVCCELPHDGPPACPTADPCP